MSRFVVLTGPERLTLSEASAGGITTCYESVRLADVFSPSCIEVVPARVGKSSILSLLVSLLVRAGRFPADRAEAAVKALLEREHFGTTAIGRGLALPHLRTTAVKRSVGAAAIVPDGANFNSLDETPTRLVLLVFSPRGDRQNQTELMGRLASLAKDKVLGYLVTPELTPAQLYEYLSKRDAPRVCGNQGIGEPRSHGTAN